MTGSGRSFAFAVFAPWQKAELAACIINNIKTILVGIGEDGPLAA